jgi:hypothetical protein
LVSGASLTASNVFLTSLILFKVAAVVANRVSQRILLVPMLPFAFFVSNLLALAWTCLYGSILIIGSLSGCLLRLWGPSCLGIRKWPLLWIGGWDFIGTMLTTVAVSRLPGPQIVLLGQVVLPMSMATSHVLLGSTFSLYQMAAVGIVISGVVVTTAASAGSSSSLFFCLLYAGGMLPYAIASTLKERLFRAHPDLPVVAVNFLTSVFQIAWSLAWLPVAAVPGLGGVPLAALPAFVAGALRCIAGQDHIPLHAPLETPDGTAVTDWTGCGAMPLPFLVYLTLNVTMNVLVLTVVKYGGAVLNFVVGTVATTLQYFAFAVDWPLLPRARLTAAHCGGFACALTGLVLYRVATLQRDADKAVGAL